MAISFPLAFLLHLFFSSSLILKHFYPTTPNIIIPNTPLPSPPFFYIYTYYIANIKRLLARGLGSHPQQEAAGRGRCQGPARPQTTDSESRNLLFLLAKTFCAAVIHLPKSPPFFPCPKHTVLYLSFHSVIHFPPTREPTYSPLIQALCNDSQVSRARHYFEVISRASCGLRTMDRRV